MQSIVLGVVLVEFYLLYQDGDFSYFYLVYDKVSVTTFCVLGKNSLKDYPKLICYYIEKFSMHFNEIMG